MKIAVLIIGVIVVSAAGWYFISPLFTAVELNEELPVAAQEEETDQAMEEPGVEEPVLQILSKGGFKPSAHEVQGDAVLLAQDNQKTLRFENFETTNGPDLHIYLATDTSAKDYVDLGPIRATKGNVNYSIAPDIDTSKYNHVLIWCEPFRVLFSYAELR